jgi:hypothetical protein
MITDLSLWITNIAAGIAKLPELLKRPQYQEWTSLAHPPRARVRPNMDCLGPVAAHLHRRRGAVTRLFGRPPTDAAPQQGASQSDRDG